MIQRLLPQPQELSYLDGTFAPNVETLIVVPARPGDDAFLAARQLQDEVCGKRSGRTLPGLQLPNVYRPNRSHTILALFDEPLAGATVEGEDALPAETSTQMRELANEAAATFDDPASGHPRALTLREMASAARLTAYAARKVALSQQIRPGLRSGDLDADRVYGYVRSLQLWTSSWRNCGPSSNRYGWSAPGAARSMSRWATTPAWPPTTLVTIAHCGRIGPTEW